MRLCLFSTWRILSDSETGGAAGRVIAAIARQESAVHSVLIYGKRGSGKFSFAHNLARNWIGGGDDESQAVKSFDSGKNPDFLKVAPLGPSRVIKEASLTPSAKAEDVPGVPVLVFLRTPPLISKRKVVLIEDVDRMPVGAANVLLKSLEEPHEYARFVLTTTSIGSLPPTIRSRCLSVSCETPTSNRTDLLWKLAEGAPGRAEQLTRIESQCTDLWDLANSMRGMSPAEALGASERLKSIADAIQKATDSNARAANAEALELLIIAIKCSQPDWSAARTELIEAHRRVLGNGNATLVMDAAMAGILA